MSEIKPKAATAVVRVGGHGGHRRKTKIVVKTPGAAQPAKLVVRVAPPRRKKHGWFWWLRSLLDGIVSFVRSLVPVLGVFA
jgi:hypothetical protein